MRINRTKLHQALMIVRPGLGPASSSKEILSQSTSFAFMGGMVITYNDRLCIQYPVPEIDFDGAVKAEELYGLLSRLKREEINLELNGSEVLVECGRVNAGLKLEEEIHLPIKKEIGHIKGWKKIPDPDLFNKHVKFAMQTCSSDQTRGKLTTVNIKKDGIVQGTDGYRLVQCVDKNNKMPFDDFLLPADLAVEVIKLKPVEIVVGKNWIHFKNEQGIIISCRTIGEDYIDQKIFRSVFVMDSDQRITFPRRVDDMLEVTRQFAKRDFVFDEQIYIEIKNGKLLMKAQREDTGSWVEEKATIKTDLNISFHITPVLFEDILKETRECVLDSKLTKAKFYHEDEYSSWEYVVMLAG